MRSYGTPHARIERGRPEAADVFLTEEGTVALQDALDGGHAIVAVDVAIAPLRWADSRACLRKIRRTNGTLRRYALAFRGTAIPLYAPAIA